MARRVVIVQHGEKVPKPGDPGLTAAGRNQAQSVARALSPDRPSIIVSSPLRRARQTARPLSDATRVAVQVEPRLRERLNLEAGADPDAFFAMWRRSTAERDWTPPGGRNSNTTADDMLMVLNEVAQDGALLVLFSHGGATVDLLRTLIGDGDLRVRCPHLIEDGPPAGTVTRLVRSIHGHWDVLAIAETPSAPRDRFRPR